MAFDLSTAKPVSYEKKPKFDITTAVPVEKSDFEKLPSSGGPGPVIPEQGISTLTGKPVTEQEMLQTEQISSVPEEIARPVLEAGGMLAGGAVGSGVGPAGTVAGAGAGYAAGKGVADKIYNPPETLPEAAFKTVKDVATGAALEAGGQLISSAFYAVKEGGKWVLKKITTPVKTLTKSGAEKAAGDILVANTSSGQIYAKNAEDAAELEKLIPGWKATLGQRTNDPQLIKLERTQIRRPGEGAQLNSEQIAGNNEALRTHYQKNFGGGENIDDLITSLEGQQQRLGTAVDDVTAAAQKEADILPVQEPEITGATAVDTLKSGRSKAKSKATSLYQKVPGDLPVETPTLYSELDSISKPMFKGEPQENIPNFLEDIKAITGVDKRATGILDASGREIKIKEPSVLKLEDLQGIRSTFIDKAKKASSGDTPNRRLASRLWKAVGAVEDAITSIQGGSSALKTANKFYREDYAETFNQGVVADILKKGPRGEATRIPVAQIPGRVWNGRNITAADQFIKAAGQENATNIMRDHAAYDLLKSATNDAGEIVTKKLNTWLYRNKKLLNRFGIADDFTGLKNAQIAVDAAKEAASQFEKSVATKILGNDPSQAIAAALSGRNAGKKTIQLMQMVAKDKAATNGLKNAFADHFVSLAETTAKDIAGKPTISNAAFNRLWKKYQPVMNELYKGSPEKIRALDAMKNAYEITVRNTKSPIGGGSDTAENIMTELGKVNVLNRTATIAKGMFGIVKKHGEEKVNQVVTRALFDPEYAQALIKAAKSKDAAELTSIIEGKIVKLSDYKKEKLGKAISATMAIQ